MTTDEYARCPLCKGRGSHVDPSIDRNGIGAEEMDELGEDFREDYMNGAYDVVCAECGGERVVPACQTPDCDEPAESRERGGGRDARDRRSTEHYDHCWAHLSEDEAEERDDRAEMLAEMEAERRMGA